jgi:hypothetical protein
MNPAAARTSAPPPVVFRDAFGERRRIVAPTGSDTLDVLCLRGELTAVPSFEFALRERVSRLAGFRNAHFAQIRTAERLTDSARTLALISNAQTGVRVSDVLLAAAKHDVVLDSDAALCLIRQLVTAMATFHEQAPDAAHGALGPERVIVTPNARLVIVEHVMGSAIEQLQYSEDRYWRELRVPCPRAAGLPVFDHRSDVLQIGMLALALLLRRVIHADEFPSRIGDAVAAARKMSVNGHMEPLPSGVRSWLTSALQIEPPTFGSAIEARDELEKVLQRHDNLGSSSALEAFMARYHERVELAAESAKQTSGHVAATPEHAPPPAHAHQPAHEPSADPIPEYVSPSLERMASQSSDRVSTPHQAAQGPAWPEPKHGAAQEPLRTDPIEREAASAPRVSREPFEPTTASPSLAAKLQRSAENVFKGSPSHTSLLSHGSTFPAVEHENDREKESIDMAPRRKGGHRAAIAAILLLLLAGGGAMAARLYLSPASVTTGTIAVTTNPPGAQVLLDGKAQGVSPTTLTVAAGTHVLELRGAGDPRTMTLDVAAGAQLSQYIEMAKGPVATGSLQVRTEPTGARVSIDGVPRGSSPLTVTDLAPGEHSVLVENDNGSTRQIVNVEAGATASLVANLANSQVSAGSSGGWISVSTPKTVQLFEDGRLLGSSDSDRLMVPAGTHQIEFVNEALGYRSARSVNVVAGRVASVKIEFPKGTIAINAIPWADVWIDGEKVGETPIGNLQLTIGTHEIIFRHPELGEQRQLATVTLNAPARVSVDMRKRP